MKAYAEGYVTAALMKREGEVVMARIEAVTMAKLMRLVRGKWSGEWAGLRMTWTTEDDRHVCRVEIDF